MVEHQEHFGKKFYKDLKKGYWISTDYPRIRAHRWVWISIHGKIPKGYHIHHKNENRSDNRIENLELIEKSRHLSHHMQDPERKKRAREHINKIRPLTKEWHASEEGRKWHQANGIISWKKRKFNKYECFSCKKKFESKTIIYAKFCSNACKSEARRKSGIDDVDKVCPVCGVLYRSNKYSRTKTCGRACGRKINGLR